MSDNSQYSLSNYELKEVRCRLVLKEGESLYYPEPLLNAKTVVNLFSDLAQELDREHCIVVNLNNKGNPISYHIISVGSINLTVVEVPNVFKTAIVQNAARILLLHNHPSGDPTPSREDINLTKRVVAAGRLLGIQCDDHVVLGMPYGRYCSIRDQQPDLFSGKFTEEHMDVVNDMNEQKESLLAKLYENEKKKAQRKAARAAQSEKSADVAL